MDITEQVISTYEKTKSMKATAAHLKISNKTVKKILVSAGIYTTDISIKVAALAKQGKSQTRNAENIRRFRKSKSL